MKQARAMCLHARSMAGLPASAVPEHARSHNPGGWWVLLPFSPGDPQLSGYRTLSRRVFLSWTRERGPALLSRIAASTDPPGSCGHWLDTVLGTRSRGTRETAWRRPTGHARNWTRGDGRGVGGKSAGLEEGLPRARPHRSPSRWRGNCVEVEGGPAWELVP